MDADSNADDRQRLVDKAQRALVAIHAGDDAEALENVTSPAGSDDQTAEIKALMLLLFSECSAMVTALGDGGAAPVKVQVFDEDGEEVSIDQADPPVRTAVRTLLAEVHGNQEAARDQVEIALASAAPDEVASLALQALRWTARLSLECVERDLPVVDWIADTIA